MTKLLSSFPIGFYQGPTAAPQQQYKSHAATLLRHLLVQRQGPRSMNDFLSSIIGEKSSIVNDTLDHVLASLSTRLTFQTHELTAYTLLTFIDETAVLMLEKENRVHVVPDVLPDTIDPETVLETAGKPFICSVRNGFDIWKEKETPLAWWAVDEPYQDDATSTVLITLCDVFFSQNPAITKAEICYMLNVNGQAAWPDLGAIAYQGETIDDDASKLLSNGLNSLITDNTLLAGMFIGNPKHAYTPYLTLKPDDCDGTTRSGHETMEFARRLTSHDMDWKRE